MCEDCPEHSIIYGAAGLAKAALGIDKAPDEVIQFRRDMCRGCDEATRNENRIDRPTKGLTTFSQCRLCDCFIAPKTRISSEKCPLGKW